jgi:hypothetical protein
MLSPRDLERHPRLLRTETVTAISDHGDSARIYALVPPPRTFNDEPTDFMFKTRSSQLFLNLFANFLHRIKAPISPDPSTRRFCPKLRSILVW